MPVFQARREEHQSLQHELLHQQSLHAQRMRAQGVPLRAGTAPPLRARMPDQAASAPSFARAHSAAAPERHVRMQQQEEGTPQRDEEFAWDLAQGEDDDTTRVLNRSKSATRRRAGAAAAAAQRVREEHAQLQAQQLQRLRQQSIIAAEPLPHKTVSASAGSFTDKEDIQVRMPCRNTIQIGTVVRQCIEWRP